MQTAFHVRRTDRSRSREKRSAAAGRIRLFGAWFRPSLRSHTRFALDGALIRRRHFRRTSFGHANDLSLDQPSNPVLRISQQVAQDVAGIRSEARGEAVLPARRMLQLDRI